MARRLRETDNWVSRRVRWETPLSADEIGRFADLFHVPACALVDDHELSRVTAQEPPIYLPPGWPNGPRTLTVEQYAAQYPPPETTTPEQSYEKGALLIAQGCQALGIDPQRALSVVRFIAWEQEQARGER